MENMPEAKMQAVVADKAEEAEIQAAVAEKAEEAEMQAEVADKAASELFDKKAKKPPCPLCLNVVQPRRQPRRSKEDATMKPEDANEGSSYEEVNEQDNPLAEKDAPGPMVNGTTIDVKDEEATMKPEDADEGSDISEERTRKRKKGPKRHPCFCCNLPLFLCEVRARRYRLQEPESETDSDDSWMQLLKM